MVKRGLLIAGALMLAWLAGCATKTPASVGLQGGQLSPCPGSPNCVSSLAVDEQHRIAGFVLIADAAESWRGVRAAVEALPRTRVVEFQDDYLHAESTSAVFGFVDDLELHLLAERLVQLRSASRVGHSDMGVNRKRVEALRALLVERDIIGVGSN